MRTIEFQDSLYRQQPAEKFQSRDINKPMDEAQLAALKKLQDDAIKDTTVQETKDAEGKQVDKDKEEGGQPEGEKRDKPGQEDTEKKQRRRPPAGGTHLIDIDA